MIRDPEPATTSAAAAPAQRRNVIAFVCGPKGSGKSQLLWDKFTSQAPRVISIDTVGEAREKNPDVVEAFGLADTIQALRFCARKGRRWHIAAALERAEIPQLFQVLAPPYSAQVTGLSAAVGGIAVECGEVDTILPNAGADEQLVGALRRGRHALLSMFYGTQRPASCARDCTAQADIIAAFATYEPRDVEYLRRTLGSQAADLLPTLEPYHCLYFAKATGKIALLNPERRVVKWLSPFSR